MKDTAVKELPTEDRSRETGIMKKETANVSTVEDCTEMKMKREVECEDDKILNDLTAGVDKLNIVPDEDVESKHSNDEQEEETSDKGDDDDGDLVTRGPNGGRPSDYMMTAPANMLPKTMPMPVMLPNGTYYQQQPMQQMPCQQQRNGNRRGYDDSEDYGQPQKYNRPLQPYYEQPAPVQSFPYNTANMTMNNNTANMTMNNNTGNLTMNNLSAMPAKFQPTMFEQSPMFPDMNFGPLDTNTTTMKITSGTTGGKVTVQNPLSPSNTIVDDFLNECDTSNINNSSYNTPSQFTSPSPNTQLDFTGSNYNEYRRQSQDTDSGLESEGVGSPWSDQAPSPGAMYASPASVDSGCSRSPMHENSNLPGMSPPKYPGACSPGNYRATPSPAGTSGYGSPAQFQPEGEFFTPDEQVELDLVLEVMENVVNEEPSKRRPKPPSVPQQPVMTPVSNNYLPQTVQQQPPVQTNRAPAQMPAQPILAPPTFNGQNVGPATTSAPQIIILQQPSNTMPQQLVILPVSSQLPNQPPKRTQPRKILPKLSGSSTSTSMSTSTSTKRGVTMATKTSTSTNRNTSQPQSNQDKTQQNKLLMIARRTVANIPREDLRRSDDEGDTYLHIAVCKTDRYMVQALLERLHREGLDSLVDQENNKRQTPLYLAVFINQPVMVAMFIKFQANVNVLAQNLSSDGMTTEVKSAIHVAASQGKEYLRTLVELLKANDISINIVNNYGQTALHCAILAHGKAKRQSTERISSIEIIQTLIKAGADPSSQDKKSGKTPLMYAIEQKNYELVESILKTVDTDKVKNVVKTQAFDGSSCMKIAEGLKDNFDVDVWNKLWNSLQGAATGSMPRYTFPVSTSVY